MLRLLVPLLLLLIGVGGGVGAGIMLSRGSETEVAASQNETDAAEEETVEEEEVDAADTSVNTPRVELAGEDTEYVRMNNQFVVPIVEDGLVRSLVVMGLTLEVETGASAEVFDREPRLRDSFLRVLFAHANAGGFNGSFTESNALAPLRSGLVEAAQLVLGRGSVYDVLITDITRQDA